MNTIDVEEHIEEEYHVSWYIIVYKLFYGCVEFLLGLAIIVYGKSAQAWYRLYVTRELSEDPHDLLVRLTRSIVPSISTHHVFLVSYLLILGAAKIAGAIGLIYKRNWGVDLLVALTTLMFPFQFVQLIRRPSLADFLYIFVGIFIALYLINFRPHEWAMRMATKIRRRTRGSYRH